MMGGLQKDCKEKSGRNCGKDDKPAGSSVIEKLIVLDSPKVMITFVLWVIHNWYNSVHIEDNHCHARLCCPDEPLIGSSVLHVPSL